MKGSQESCEFCDCYVAPSHHLSHDKALGIDNRLAEVCILICRDCGQHWLRYFYEVEAFTASGRWYLGAVTPEQSSRLTAESAKATLEALNWYYYGGSYYQGQIGKTSGKILLAT